MIRRQSVPGGRHQIPPGRIGFCLWHCRIYKSFSLPPARLRSAWPPPRVHKTAVILSRTGVGLLGRRRRRASSQPLGLALRSTSAGRRPHRLRTPAAPVCNGRGPASSVLLQQSSAAAAATADTAVAAAAGADAAADAGAVVASFLLSLSLLLIPSSFFPCESASSNARARTNPLPPPPPN